MFVYPSFSSFCNISDKLKDLLRKPPRLLISPNHNLRGLLMTKRRVSWPALLLFGDANFKSSLSIGASIARIGGGEFPHRNFHFDSGAIRKWLATSKCDCLASLIYRCRGHFTFFYQLFFFFCFDIQLQLFSSSRFFSVTKAGAVQRLPRTTYTLSFAAQHGSGV